MNRRWLNNFIAVCFVVVFLTLIFLLSGCAGQGVKLNVETENTKCGTKNVQFSTDYQVEQLAIGRTIEGGGDDEGCGGGYTVTLGKGTTKDAEYGALVEMMRMFMGAMGFNGSTQTLTPPNDADAIFEAGVEKGRRIQTEEFNRKR